MADLDLSKRWLGEFVVGERIGAGGYGTVYRCEQPALQREAVIKVLHAQRGKNDAAYERFTREARLASRLDHPYAAHVYSFGVEERDGLLWIAMELVQGITLSAWLKARGPMPLGQFVPFFDDVTQVVQAAHELGIVHRDVKPSNLMVMEIGGRLFPKLLDFGIAKWNESPDEADSEAGLEENASDESVDRVPTVKIRVTPQRVQRTHTGSFRPDCLTRSGIVLGSAPYMSPEQWRAPDAVGPGTDIYSLGCVAYEALTGRPPFIAADTREYYRQHRLGDPPPLGNELSPSLDRVLHRALAKSPEARHGSALELAAELRAALRAEPREQLRAAAQQWHDRARLVGLLWGRDVLAVVERCTPPSALNDLERSFLAASQRRARRVRWVQRALVAVAVVGAIGFAQYRYHSAMRTQLAEQQAQLAEQQARLAEQQARLAEQETRATRELIEARITDSELEQGRSALLHGESEAFAHLTEAYKRDPSPTTAFMLARSIQPRLAEQARFASTYGRMWWATFSPDGKQIATADDRAAQIWDAQTYQLRFTLPHGCEVYQVVYSPDGTRLVTTAQTAVKIWDTATGTLVRELKAGPGGRTPSDYYRAAISPDGKMIAAIHATGSIVHVWDATHGGLIAELRNTGKAFPRLAFSSEGWLATTGGNEASVFNIRTWRPVLKIPGPGIHSLAFDSQGRLVTGAATGEVVLWAVREGARLRQLRQFGEPVDAVAFSVNDHLVAAGSRDGALQVWHADSGALQTQLNPRHSKILAMEFDPTSRLVVAANADGTVVVADTAQGLPIAVLDGPQNVVLAARFDPISRRVVGASWDGTARVWDATSPYRRWSSEPVNDDCGIVMSSEPDRRFVAVGCRDRPTRVWDTAHDQLLAELPSVTPINGGGFTSAYPVVSAAGDRAAIARASVVAVHELPGGRLVRTVEHGAAVSAVAFAGAGRDLVSGAVDGSVLITREDGTQRTLQAAAGIDAVELLPDGKVIVCDAERRLRVYASSGDVLVDLETPARIMSLRRDGPRVVALSSYTSNAAPPLLIDLERGRIVAQLEGHTGQVFSTRWVTEGRIITAGADGTARLWDGATGRLLQTYRGGPRFLADATLTPEGLVIGGDADGLLRFWDAASGAKLWTLQAHKSAVIRIHVQDGDIVTRGFSGDISRWRLPKPEEVLAACARHARCPIVPP